MQRPGIYRDTLGWNCAFAAYWAATSYKWFIVLLYTVPTQVAAIVPSDQKNSTWGMVYGIGAIWAMIGSALFGGWSDRFRSRWGHRSPFIAAGAALTVVAVAVLGAAATVPGLVLGYLMLQVADDVGTGPYGALVPEIVPEDRRGRASATMTVLQRFGEVGSALVAVAFGRTDLVYAAIGVVTVVGSLFTLWALRGLRPAESVNPAPLKFFAGWAQVWKTPDFVPLWTIRLLASTALFLVTNYVLYYLRDMFPDYRAFGIDLQTPGRTAQILAISVSISGVIGALLAGKLADTIGRKKLFVVSGVLIFLVLVPFALARDVGLLFLITVPFGIGSGMRASVDWAMASDAADTKRPGAFMGLWTSSQTAAQILVGGAGTGIDALNRSQPGLGYQVAIWSGGLLFLACTSMVRFVRSSR